MRRRVIAAILAMPLVLPTTAVSQEARAAKAADYVFSQVAALGDPAPGGSTYTFDFEPYGINAAGDLLFGADLAIAGGGEGVFLVHQGQVSPLARSGDPAPGGGTFFGALGNGVLGPGVSLNAPGDAAFVFFLTPFGFPPVLGLNAGVYRYSHTSGMVTPVVVPYATPVPGGGTFAGATLHASLNNGGRLAFAGIVPSTAGVAGNGLGLGVGVFKVDEVGRISSVVIPGDPAPGGGTFDFAQSPWINGGGDIAFGAHVAGEECVDIGGGPIICGESVYLRKAATGQMLSIAHQGDAAPGGGTYRIAFGPVLNARGDIAFIGDLTPAPEVAKSLGVFLHSGDTTFPIARPGDALPGGGNLLTAGFLQSTYDMNNSGNVSFSAELDTMTNGVPDTGLYVWSHGSLHLVARTGTVIPDVGTIVKLQPPSFSGMPSLGGAMNERGQLLFTATVVNENGTNSVLLVATPKG